IAMYEQTGEASYLAHAAAWQHALDRHYANPQSGAYFLSADDAAGLIVRPSATWDDATPNPSAVAAQNLVRLAVLTGDDAWRVRADRLFDDMLPFVATNPVAHAAFLNALDVR